VVSGPWDNERMLATLREVRRLGTEQGVNRVLFDCGGIAPPRSEFVRFQTGVAFAEVLGPRFRSAAVVPAAMITRFTEDVAVNRGARLLVTDDHEAARLWLLG
jgi:hypothetical protein